MEQNIKTVYLMNLFKKHKIKILTVIGGDHKKNYNTLKPVLGLKEILQVSHDEKEHKICKYIKRSNIVVTVPMKKDVFKYHIKKALKKYPRPYIHTRGGSSSTNIIESLYVKRKSLNSILETGYGEI